MMTLVGPVLVLSGFGLYMLSNTLLGRFRRIPWEFLAVSALGLVLALAIMLRDGGTANIIAAVASAVLSGFLLDERGVIRWVYRPDTYRMRASVDEIVAAIDALPAA